MYKMMKSLFVFGMVTSFTCVFASGQKEIQNKAPAEEQNQTARGEIDINKVSEAFGHLIGKNLENLEFDFDIDQVVKGMQDSVAGKESPMNETECVQAISIVQEESFQKLAKRNLEAANSFLKENLKKEGIVELEKNKIQYRVEKEGNGTTVENHHSPLIRYEGKFLDGKVFGASKEGEMISLDETIGGFKQGIVGMKEGEKRKIFIHPEEGYGTSGYLPPNSLLVFDVEVLKANASPEQEEALSTVQSYDAEEIAESGSSPEASLR